MSAKSVDQQRHFFKNAISFGISDSDKINNLTLTYESNIADKLISHGGYIKYRKEFQQIITLLKLENSEFNNAIAHQK